MISPSHMLYLSEVGKLDCVREIPIKIYLQTPEPLENSQEKYKDNIKLSMKTEVWPVRKWQVFQRNCELQ